MKEVLANNIRALRTSLRYSQADLGGLAGIEKGTITAIENGRSWPSPEKLAAVAKVLGVEPFELLMTKAQRELWAKAKSMQNEASTEERLAEIEKNLPSILKLMEKINETNKKLAEMKKKRDEKA